MNQTFFVHQDTYAFERQSDGVEMCIISSINPEKIHFYCQEYMVYWADINDVGDLEKSKPYKKGLSFRPATLLEIANNELINYVDSVKQYCYSDSTLSEINRIIF